MNLFLRAPTPILSPSASIPWASGAIFNPGAVVDDDGTLRLLARGIAKGYKPVALDSDNPYEPANRYEDYISHLGLATRRADGSFVVDAEPFISPGTDIDRYGVEDARITRLGGRYYMTYTVLSEPAHIADAGVGIGLASTTDWKSVTVYGRIGPQVRDKDAALFPNLVRGRIAMFHRIVPDMQVVYFADEEQLVNPGATFWEAHLNRLDDFVVMRPEQVWEGKKVGIGPPPIETREGWLVVYHAADLDHVYRAGLALLDLDDPRKVIARSRYPVMEPTYSYEIEGDIPNVVFPQGAIVEDGLLRLYYGAGDTVIGEASAPLDDVMALLNEERRPGRSRSPHLDFHGHLERPRRLAGVHIPVERLHGGRPILEPVTSHNWESRVVLNPAAVLVDDLAELENLMETWNLDQDKRDTLRKAGGACVVVYRAQGSAFERPNPVDAARPHVASALGLGVFTPTLELIRRWSEPVITPEASFHDLGVEDARCTKVDGTYYLHYTGYTTEGVEHPSVLGRVHLCLATTTNFVDWELHGPLTGDVNKHDDKNGALFPTPVAGVWWFWHRPMGGEHPMAIHLASAPSPLGPWTSRGCVLASYRFEDQATSWVGAAGPPVSIGDDRFLALYHQGHRSFDGRRLYNLSAMLVEPAAAEPILSRLEPLLLPEGDLERHGDPLLGVDNVVFSCANYRLGDQLIIPYAGADSRIFAASVRFEALLEELGSAVAA